MFSKLAEDYEQKKSTHIQNQFWILYSKTDRWSHNYCKKLLWWVNWIFHSEKNTVSSCAISCI